ncbi:hypothetical protein ACFPVS_08335 [Neisseria weixii]|uniref:Uncharacterized protein n=1 Tax=Neisseria weixii TaxID=1853276 RepID=A0A3N4N6S1_9NEIS|nr:hypothetical protein [Neisseria weixii]RPD87019.1 hypothetical protein EGK74_06785 [Neisseria weixii]RPD89237.1 hypothetical protein EGK75_05480 [Neisseria weixii]
MISDTILDFIRNIFQKYKKPVIILVINEVIYYIFGVTNECGVRCPMPPMTALENLLSTASSVIMYACLLWIMVIYMSDKYDKM